MDPNLEKLFKKWEAHSSGPSRSSGASTANDTESQRGREAWQREFGNFEAPIRQPSRYRPRKRKPKVVHAG